MEKKNTTTNSSEDKKLCKHCQSEIPKKAKVCPNCHKKQGGKAKWIVIAVIVVLVIAAAATGNATDKKSIAKKTGTVSGNDTGKENVTTKDNHFRVGDIVETKDMKISYISAGEYTSDNQFLQPGEGKVYYRMEFEFENISDEDQTISSLVSWGCYADGYAADQAYIGEDGIDVTLSPGKKAKGAVYYEVPKDASEITLEYETDFLSSDKIIFIVK